MAKFKPSYRSYYLLLEHWVSAEVEYITVVAIADERKDIPKTDSGEWGGGQRSYAVWKKKVLVEDHYTWDEWNARLPAIGLRFYPDDGPGRWIALRKLLKGAKPCK